MEIEQKDIKGGQLLNLLHKRCHCGIPELQICIQRYCLDYSYICVFWRKLTAISIPFVFAWKPLYFHFHCHYFFFYLHISYAPMTSCLLIHFIFIDGKNKNRLLWHGHQVMFNQLTSWMVYGILQDQYHEFFIRRSAWLTEPPVNCLVIWHLYSHIQLLLDCFWSIIATYPIRHFGLLNGMQTFQLEEHKSQVLLKFRLWFE